MNGIHVRLDNNRELVKSGLDRAFLQVNTAVPDSMILIFCLHVLFLQT
jgi:hypothetical protein